VLHYLDNIRRHQHLNAFLAVYDQEALEQADRIDQKLSDGTAGRLAGMVIGLKDVLCYQSHRVQAGSRILDGFQSQFTATAVQRVIDEDAIIIGHQNCDEFAMGSSTENSAFGPTLNGDDPGFVPGGSSGGSVRQPAAFCGVVGLKPTYSRISRHGLVAYGSSFDIIGPFTHTIEDTALLLEVMAGADEYDSTVSHAPVPPYAQQLSFDATQPLRVAYLPETLDDEGLHPAVKQATERTLDFLRAEGHTVEAVQFPLLKYVLPVYYILTMAEASSNLSRYDGVKFGYRSEHRSSLEEMYKKTRTEAFGEEVKRRIMLGTFVLSADYYDAYYTKAQKVRRMLQDATRKILAEYDFIVLPTTPTPAFALGTHADPLEMYLADLFTVQASIAGVPAISIPNGNDEQGLPIGLQIIGDVFQESRLLAFSQYILARNA
jgi:aspartyl-tRNA(Asn)/glutamyl-tRNA(Gln) amidotransferase subunit A